MENNIPERLIVRYLAHEASSDEQEELLDWLSQSPVNQNFFNSMAELYQSARPHVLGFDVQRATDNINARIEIHERLRNRTRLRLGSIAAALIILTTALIGTFLYHAEQNQSAGMVYASRQNPPGQRSVITLYDGSVVRLNANSTLRFPEKFGENERRVILSGEGFFEIEEDSSRPFIIETGTVTTQVLGTSFNIVAREERVEVAVASGLVRVSEGTHQLLLEPFEKATYTYNDKRWTKDSTDLKREIAWTNNVFAVQDEPLSEIITRLEDWYGVSIEAQPDILACRITATFKNETLTNVLSAITYSIDCRFTIKDRKVTLSGKGCNVTTK